MAEKKYSIASDAPLSISADAAEKLISSGDGNASLLYIYLIRKKGEASPADVSRELKCSPSETDRAFDKLVSLGLVNSAPEKKTTPAAAEELPSYTAEDVKNELENNAVFPVLVSEVQARLGKILSSDDLLRLFGIYDSLGLPPEVILTLVNHCISEFDERYSGSRRPTMRYIEKAAFSWERDGIYTLELAEEYIKRTVERRAKGRRIVSVLNINDRPLTASERKYVDKWSDMGFPPETVEIAYDRTVLRTGKLSWNYMDSILKSWYSKKLFTPEEVMTENVRQPANTGKSKKNGVPSQTATPDDISRMRKLIEEMNDVKEAK